MQHYAIVTVKNNAPVLDASDVHHATKVMRMKTGDRFVALWNNARHLCSVISASPFVVAFERTVLPSNEPVVKVHALLAVIKPAQFELAVQKCVENGVFLITPVVTRRSQRTDLNLPRLQRIAKEAAEQSQRDYVPAVQPPIRLEQAAVNAQGDKYVLDLKAEKSLYARNKSSVHVCTMAIGPEGGWDQSELDFLKASGFEARSLGRTVLRAETAALVSVHALCWSFNES